MRSRFACAAIVLLALLAGQALATDQYTNEWTVPGPKKNENVYSATCDLPGKVTSKVVYAPLNVTITGPANPTTGVRTTYDATPGIQCKSKVDLTAPDAVDLLPGANFKLGNTVIFCEAKVPELEEFTASNRFSINLVDMTRPEVTIVAPSIKVNAAPTFPGSVTVDFSDNVKITDACDDNPTLSCSAALNATYTAGSTTTVSCGGFDNKGNQAVPQNFTITVEDKTPPTLPTELTSNKVLELEAAGPDGNRVDDLAKFVATDNVDPSVPVVCIGAQDLFPVNSTTVVKCSATDQAGNFANGTITVIVRDTKAPSIVIAPTDPIEADNKDGMVVPGGLAAKISTEDFNLVDPTPVVTCVPALVPTPVFPLDTTTPVTCTSTDKYGNAASNTTTITVRDTKPPTMPTPKTPYEEIFLETNTTGILTTFGNATDLVWGSIPLVCEPPVGSSLPLTGEIVNVVCKATDGSNNTATETYPVKVVRPPSELTINVPANATLNATSGPLGAPFPYTVTATDSLADRPQLKLRCVDVAAPSVAVLDTSATPSASPATASVSATFALGTTVISCTVTNRVGSTDTKAFQVTVTDQTKPIVTGADWEQEATGFLTPVPYRSLTSLAATDDITPKPNLPIVCTGAPGDASETSPGFKVGKTPITCTTTDAAGNKADPITVIVSIVDTKPPVCSPLDLAATYAVDPATGQEIPSSIFANCTDLVDPTPKHTCTPVLPIKITPTEPPTPTTIVCCSEDFSGNTACVNATTTVTDGQAPVLVVPQNMEVEAQGPDGSTVAFEIVGRTTTNRNLDVTVTCNDTAPAFTATAKGAPGQAAAFSGLFGPVSSVANPEPVLCTASTTNPFNGLTTTKDFTITVLDRVGPKVGQLPDITVAAPVEGDVTVSLPIPTVTDEPSATPVDPKPSVTCNYGPGSVAFNYSVDPITVTCSGTDKYGNVGPSMSYKVIMTKGPVPDLQCPADIKVSLSACQANASVAYTVTVKDGKPPKCNIASPVKVAPGKPVTVTCTSENRFGEDKCNFTITATDGVPPEVYVPCDFTREACALGGFYLTKKDIEGSVRAVDNRDGKIPATCTWPESAGVKYDAQKNAYLFPVGVTTITCTATDSSGNSASKSYKVTITDTRRPWILTNLCNRPYCAATAAGASIAFSPTARDIVDGSVAVTVSVAGMTFTAPATKTLPLGKHTIVYTATDKAKNTRTVKIRDLWVIDCEAPKVTAPKAPQGNRYFYYDASSTGGIRIRDLPACTATDNITPAAELRITYRPAATTVFPAGIHTITCFATDKAGNTGKATYEISVKGAPQHCHEAYQHSARIPGSCDVQRHFKKLKEAVELRKSSFEICACHAEVDRQISKPYVQALLRKSSAWSSCQSSYNKAKFLSGCGRSSARRMLA